jgi:hypothetical protein
VLRTRPSQEIVAAFSDQLQREVGTKAVDPGDVLPEQREQRQADIKGQPVDLIGSPTRRWQGFAIVTATDAEFLQDGFDPDVAGQNLLVISIIEGKCLF